MKATKYTNKELVEIYKNLKTSAKILGFSSANDSEMIAEIELEAIKRHLNLVDGTVEETAELEAETNETTVETVKKTEKVIKKPETEEAVETIAEQTQADEAAETEPAKTPKSENVPYKMKWTNQNVDYSRANYTAVIFKFNNSKVWLQLDCVCSTQTARATIRKLGKWFGSKSVDVKYFSDQTNEKIVSVCQLYDNSGYIFRNEIAVKNGEKRQFIKYAAKEIFE